MQIMGDASRCGKPNHEDEVYPLWILKKLATGVRRRKKIDVNNSEKVQKGRDRMNLERYVVPRKT